MQQMTIFDTVRDETQDWTNKKVRLIELFAGIGAQAAALERIGVDFEKYLISEWDTAATRSYNAIHVKDWTDYSQGISGNELPGILFEIGISTNGKNQMTEEQIRRKGEKWQRKTYNDFKATRNIGSITNRTGQDLKICERDKYLYILTYSFPCQDLSVAGNCRGMKKGSGTRSGLLWEVERLLTETEELPQILLMENVTQVHNKRNAADFNDWMNYLQKRGYVNFISDINAEDHGIAQHRIRTFVVSILRGGGYHFPEKKPLETTINDYLETSVNERYYINSERGKELIQNLIESGTEIKEFQAIDANVSDPKIITSATCIKTKVRSIQNKKSAETAVVEKRIHRLGNYLGHTGGNFAGTVFGVNGSAPTIRTPTGVNVQPIIIDATGNEIRLRRLTEREEWRLMGFTDEQFDDASRAGIVSTQLYKQAGNTIVVPVLMEIFRNMNLKKKPETIFRIRQATKRGYIEVVRGGGSRRSCISE
ncbi:DNA (cytosine-5-)-methyltransferase [Lachnospiraceae bacterium 50-23]